MRAILHEISKGKNLEENLPRYATTLLSFYHRFASVQLAMNYYGYYEVIEESDSSHHKEMKEILEKINQIIGDVLIPGKMGEELEQAVISLDHIRNQIIASMEALTSYTDIFNIYEYILNRTEHRFDGKKLPGAYDDEMFANTILEYILHDRDNNVINTKISEVIRELPVRMARGKFYELVKAGVTLYSGGTKESLDDFLYMLRTSALLSIPDGMEKYEELHSIYQELSKADFKELTQAQWKEFHDKIYFASSFLQNMVDRYVMITQVLNETYAVLLSMPYALKEVKEDQICKQILEGVNKHFTEGANRTLDDEVTDLLIELEGKQEELSEAYLPYESILFDIRAQYTDLIEGLMLGKQFHCLYGIQALLSGNYFVDLEKKMQDTQVERAYVDQCAEDLIKELDTFFHEHKREVNRAVMAAVLSSLPTFFENVDAIQEYVLQSLRGCSDEAEKLAVVEVMNLIEEDGI